MNNPEAIKNGLGILYPKANEVRVAWEPDRVTARVYGAVLRFEDMPKIALIFGTERLDFAGGCGSCGLVIRAKEDR